MLTKLAILSKIYVSARSLSIFVILTIKKLEANPRVIKIASEEKCFIYEKFDYIAQEYSNKEKNDYNYFNTRIQKINMKFDNDKSNLKKK